MTKALKSLNPVNRSRLHEEIVGQIQKKIVSGELQVGEKLPSERELAASFDVNRATVREALKKLELLGLVEILHGDGIYVKNYLDSGNLELLRMLMYMNNGVDVTILSNLLDARRIVTPQMAAKAAEFLTEKHLEELKDLISDEEMNTLEKDLRVHHIVGKASNNLFYVFILNFFNEIFRDYGYLYFDESDNVDRSLKFHREIYEALQDKRGDDAQRIMTEILDFTEKQIYRKYRELTI